MCEPGVDVHPEIAPEGARSRQPQRHVDQPPACRLVVEEDGLGDGQVRRDVHFLSQQCDAAALRLANRGARKGRPSSAIRPA